MTEKCRAKVWDTYRHYPCQFTAKYDGYCGHHDPARLAAKRKKRDERWADKSAADAARRETARQDRELAAKAREVVAVWLSDYQPHESKLWDVLDELAIIVKTKEVKL